MSYSINNFYLIFDFILNYSIKIFFIVNVIYFNSYGNVLYLYQLNIYTGEQIDNLSRNEKEMKK